MTAETFDSGDSDVHRKLPAYRADYRRQNHFRQIPRAVFAEQRRETVIKSLFAYQSIFQGTVSKRVAVYIFRVFAAYLITLAVIALLLFAIDKFPILSDPVVALKRLIIIAMPASMGAIIVDSIDKE